MPSIYHGSSLNGPDHPAMPTRARPIAPVPDAPLAQGWLLNTLGAGFTLLTTDAGAPDQITAHGLTAIRLAITSKNDDPLHTRFLGNALAAVYLLRPDQHVAARWDAYDERAVAHAIGKAIGKT